MATPDEILLSMGIDPDEAERADAELTLNAKATDKRICLCGHAAGRHDMTLGRPACLVGRMSCNCKTLNLVLEVSDVRPFIRKTEGSALNHALSRGIAAARKADITVEKIESAWHCHKCEATGDDLRLTPMAVTRNGLPAQEDTGFNAFFCDDCRLRG